MRANGASPLRSDEAEYRHHALVFMTVEQRPNENGMMNPANHESQDESARIAPTSPEEPIENKNRVLD
jgi:hypothetical protein